MFNEFFLILTFESGGSVITVTIPKPYYKLEHCIDAGKQAIENYTGTAIVHYTYVIRPN